ncbi:ABC transporter permease [Zhouia sp. PK063]|uniref:ABC transporter permease n=1 Tax=Zhouia sp. PK063 TaxID=3373602 RepID=UPI0037B1D89D
MSNQRWLYEISSKKPLLAFNFKEVWRYRDLLFLFVKRDVVTLYKQTILGPLWYLIQPLFTSVIFTLVFNNIANISTENIPSFLFNLAGITTWNYFRECLLNTSTTFTANAGIFGKVYFPRIIMPLSTVISNLLKFGIQLVILTCFYIYFLLKDASVTPNYTLIAFPLIIFIMALLGLGFGMIISAMTTKYRDLTYLVTFGVQLLMYISAVMYPMSAVANGKLANYGWIVYYNPMAQLINAFRYMIFSIGLFSWLHIVYTLLFAVIIFLIGLLIFNRTERTFIDTV